MEKTLSPKNAPPQNRMGTDSIPFLLIKMALPMMFAMLIQSLYNIVDTMFVAQISSSALKALSLANPFQTLIAGVATGTGVGINALVSRRLGEKNQPGADASATNGLFLGIISGIVLGIAIGGFARPMLATFTPSPETLDMSVTYLSICASMCIFNITGVILGKILLSTGSTVQSMLTQLVGAIANIILDPIMIFGKFGFPVMGVAGAALATVIGQTLSMLLGFYILLRKNKMVSIRIKKFRPNLKIIGEIYNVGLPVICMYALGSFTNFCLNKILLGLSESAISVLGIYYKLQSFVYMPVYGFSAGQLSILSYNFGAKNKARMMTTLKYSMIYMLVIMALGTAVFHAIPDKLLMMFNADQELLSIGIGALRKISLCFIFAAIGIALSNVYQAVGRGPLSLVVSISRQVGLVIPSAYLLAKFVGLSTVWYCFPIAEVVSSTLYVAFMIYVYKKDLKPLDNMKPAQIPAAQL